MVKIDFKNMNESIKERRLEKLIEIAKGEGISFIFNIKGLSEQDVKAIKQKIMAIEAIANNPDILEEQFSSEIKRIKDMNPFFLK